MRATQRLTQIKPATIKTMNALSTLLSIAASFQINVSPVPQAQCNVTSTQALCSYVSAPPEPSAPEPTYCQPSINLTPDTIPCGTETTDGIDPNLSNN